MGAKKGKNERFGGGRREQIGFEGCRDDFLGGSFGLLLGFSDKLLFNDLMMKRCRGKLDVMESEKFRGTGGNVGSCPEPRSGQGAERAAQAGQSPSLEVFKGRLDVVLSDVV